PRDPEPTSHTLLEMARSPVYGILAGYEDQNAHDPLSSDPVVKLLADRSPEDDDLASQPTLSRFENAISIQSLKRLRDVFLDQFIASFGRGVEGLLLGGHARRLAARSRVGCPGRFGTHRTARARGGSARGRSFDEINPSGPRSGRPPRPHQGPPCAALSGPASPWGIPTCVTVVLKPRNRVKGGGRAPVGA